MFLARRNWVNFLFFCNFFFNQISELRIRIWYDRTNQKTHQFIHFAFGFWLVVLRLSDLIRMWLDWPQPRYLYDWRIHKRLHSHPKIYNVLEKNYTVRAKIGGNRDTDRAANSYNSTSYNNNSNSRNLKIRQRWLWSVDIWNARVHTLFKTISA